MRTSIRSVIAALLALAVSAGLACAQTGAAKSKAVLSAEIATCFPDNLVGTITPASVRSCMQDFLASWGQFPGVNPQVGTSYTIAASDYGQMITFNNAGAVAVTLPVPSTWATGAFNFEVLNLGAGLVIITPSGGITINGAANFQVAQNSSIEVRSDGALGTNYEVFQGRTALPTGTNGQVFLGVTGSAAVFATMSQDCTVTNAGVITCTKTNNVLFGPFATVASGTSGGVPCWTAASAIGSSAALTANGIVIGGGAGACPSVIGVGTNGQMVFGVTGAAPQMATLSQDCTVTNAGVITCTKTNNVAFTAFATQAVPCLISQGCTGQTSANAARQSSGLNIFGDQGTGHGDSIYTILNTDRCAFTNAAFTASRTWTLPAANVTGAPYMICVLDLQGTVTAVNTLVIARAGADTINGGTSVTISSANGGYILLSDGTSKWSAQALGSTAAAGVSTIGGLSGTVGLGPCLPVTGSNIYVQCGDPGGRLTLQSGVPVMTSTQSAQTTLYYAPYKNSLIPIYDGTSTRMFQFTANTTDAVGLSVVLGSNWAAASVHDVYVGVNGSTVTLCTVAWTNTTTRATTLAMFNGLLTNSAAATCRYSNTQTFSCSQNQCTYVGTVLTNAQGQIDFTFGSSAGSCGAARFGVWNNYNRVSVSTTITDSTASWNPAAADVWEALHNSATCRATIVVGQVEDGVVINHNGFGFSSSGAYIGIGVNSTTTPSGSTGVIPNNNVSIGTTSAFFGMPAGVGLQFYSALERAVSVAANSTLEGSNAPGFGGYFFNWRL